MLAGASSPEVYCLNLEQVFKQYNFFEPMSVYTHVTGSFSHSQGQFMAPFVTRSPAINVIGRRSCFKSFSTF